MPDLSEGNIITVTRGEFTVGFLAHMPAPIPKGEAVGPHDRTI